MLIVISLRFPQWSWCVDRDWIRGLNCQSSIHSQMGKVLIISENKSQLTSIPRARSSPCRARRIRPASRCGCDCVRCRIRRRLSSRCKDFDPVVSPITVITATVDILNLICDIITRLGPYGEVFDGDVFSRDGIAADEVEGWTLCSIGDAT